ncbi:hypothetical protein LEP1GSC126_2735 [Leptospira kirschneri str. 200801774]|nr:hypothetical protein LEP1GSC126_2735 [Leptospira kirschneri str. 200801774]
MNLILKFHNNLTEAKEPGPAAVASRIRPNFITSNSRYFIFSRKLNFIKTNSILLKRTVVESRNKFFPQFF